jgi:hypothetical protein
MPDRPVAVWTRGPSRPSAIAAANAWYFFFKNHADGRRRGF